MKKLDLWIDPNAGLISKQNDHLWWMTQLWWVSPLCAKSWTEAHLRNVYSRFLFATTEKSLKGWLPSAKLKPTFTFLDRDFAI